MLARSSEIDFQAKLAAARLDEIRFSNYVRTRNRRYVVPTYDYSGQGENKAPKLLAPPGCKDLILPDLLELGHGLQRFYEVKSRNWQRWETGISTRLWNHYREVQGRTKIPVFLCFLHEKEDELRVGSIGGLTSHARQYFGTKMGYGGMTFFDYFQIPLIGTLEVLK